MQRAASNRGAHHQPSYIAPIIPVDASTNSMNANADAHENVCKCVHTVLYLVIITIIITVLIIIIMTRK